jgi:hypothetical protein
LRALAAVSSLGYVTLRRLFGHWKLRHWKLPAILDTMRGGGRAGDDHFDTSVLLTSLRRTIICHR